MSATVLVVGSLHYDMILSAPRLPRLGETLAADGWQSKCGGKGGNQAVEAARYGAATAMIGCVGPDEMGERLLGNLRTGGVDTSHVRVAATGSGLSVALSEGTGDYAAVIATGANACLEEGDLAGAEALIGDARVVVLQNEIPDRVNQAAANRARSAGARVVWNAAPARPSEAMMGLVDVLVVNAIEAEMFGTAPVTDLDSAALAAAELGRRVPAAVVTAGGDGVAWGEAGSVRRLAPHRIRLVSTHGAGDAFIGALAAKLAQGADLERALVVANAAAAMLVATPEADRAALTSSSADSLLGEALTGQERQKRD